MIPRGSSLAVAPNRRDAFTLVEVLVTVAIIGILAGVATPRLMTASAESRLAKERTVIQTVSLAKLRYILENGAVGLDGSGTNGAAGSGGTGGSTGTSGNGNGNGGGNGNGNGNGNGSGSGSGGGTLAGAVTELERWIAVRPYIHVRGVTPATMADLIGGTGKTNLIVGDSATWPSLQ